MTIDCAGEVGRDGVEVSVLHGRVLVVIASAFSRVRG